MSEARDIEIGPVVDRLGGLDLVLIGANDPDAMLRHTQECRQRGIPFAADPSQQLARMNGAEIRELVEGAAYLFTNEYEAALTEAKTGWSEDDVLDRVGVRITTLGKNGARVEQKGTEPVVVSCPDEELKADPTGVGDAFRAGYLAGLAWGVGPERCAQVGSLLATYVIETIGTQEYALARARFLERVAKAYGDEAVSDIEEHVICPRP